MAAQAAGAAGRDWVRFQEEKRAEELKANREIAKVRSDARAAAIRAGLRGFDQDQAVHEEVKPFIEGFLKDTQPSDIGCIPAHVPPIVRVQLQHSLAELHTQIYKLKRMEFASITTTIEPLLQRHYERLDAALKKYPRSFQFLTDPAKYRKQVPVLNARLNAYIKIANDAGAEPSEIAFARDTLVSWYFILYVNMWFGGREYIPQNAFFYPSVFGPLPPKLDFDISGTDGIKLDAGFYFGNRLSSAQKFLRAASLACILAGRFPTEADVVEAIRTTRDFKRADEVAAAFAGGAAPAGAAAAAAAADGPFS